jgi:hypothetical protein
MIGKDKNKKVEETAKKEPEQKPFWSVPTQKTFIFDDSKREKNGPWTAEEIDKTVNAWTLEQTTKGVPVFLGKVTASPGVVIYVFMYTTKVDRA